MDPTGFYLPFCGARICMRVYLAGSLTTAVCCCGQVVVGKKGEEEAAAQAAAKAIGDKFAAGIDDAEAFRTVTAVRALIPSSLLCFCVSPPVHAGPILRFCTR